jgi:hypothetical protein
MAEWAPGEAVGERVLWWIVLVIAVGFSILFWGLLLIWWQKWTPRERWRLFLSALFL